MVLQRYQASVPDHVLMRVMNELGFGARKTLEACIRSNRERCLTAGKPSHSPLSTCEWISCKAAGCTAPATDCSHGPRMLVLL